MTPTSVEQIFLEPKGGGIEVLLVLENQAGARTRERAPLPTQDARKATELLARRLAYRGVQPARLVRLRVAGRDDPALLELFLRVLERESADDSVD